jgi:hypothetical protein
MADGFSTESAQAYAASEPRSRVSRFHSGVPCADYDDIEF